MLLMTYIETHYGSNRGNKAGFLRDNPDILPQELSRWIKAGLKINPATGEIYKPTSKTINIKTENVVRTTGFSPETVAKLAACAAQANMNADQWINYLLNHEIERTEILNYVKSGANAGNGSDTPVQVIAEVINRHFSCLSHRSEIFEFRAVFQALMPELLEKQLVHVLVPEHMIAESKRIAIPRTDYYWFGGVVAKHTAMMLGAYEVYLWHEWAHPESEVLFLGAPNNVVACNFICGKICKLLKQIKSHHKKEQGGWGSKRDIEDSANEYVAQFAKGIFDPRLYILEEKSQMRLINYASNHYSYAMD